MKRSYWVLTSIGLALVVGASIRYYTKAPQAPDIADAETSAALAEAAPSMETQPTEPSLPPIPRPPAKPLQRVTTARPAPSALTPPSLTINIDLLLRTETTFADKQAAWNQFKQTGKLDQVIEALEQRASANPNAPEVPAALGQAYLQKASTLQDIPEMGILGMKADQAFTTALQLDPANWEARFWKASAMSYWPQELNKGREVLQQFVTLIEQQEAGSPQPHYAQTYVLLGEQYQRQGYAEYAQAVWQRGATLFPQHEVLHAKLASQ